MLKSTGIIKVDQKNSRIVVDVSEDFIKLYAWFIRKQYWISLQRPMHNAHITIANEKFHSNINWEKAKQYHNKIIEFEYDPYLIRGGRTKGFLMFYLKVISPEIEKIKEELKIVETENYKGLHITVANGKSNGVRPYWPETIEIR
jgi:hypothetical protein